jgi:hypothetical protein
VEVISCHCTGHIHHRIHAIRVTEPRDIIEITVGMNTRTTAGLGTMLDASAAMATAWPAVDRGYQPHSKKAQRGLFLVAGGGGNQDPQNVRLCSPDLKTLGPSMQLASGRSKAGARPAVGMEADCGGDGGQTLPQSQSPGEERGSGADNVSLFFFFLYSSPRPSPSGNLQ